MLAVSVVEEIARLLDEGQLSRRQIARRIGVSRGAVCAIANGQRGRHGRAEALDPEMEPLGLPARCPHCGFLVYMPCLVCRTREFRQGRRSLEALEKGRSEIARHQARHRGRRLSTCRARVA